MQEKPKQQLLKVLDVFFLILENLLAFRIVMSYLGNEQSIFHAISNVVLFPLSGLMQKAVYRVDNSTLDILAVVIVFILLGLHKLVDKKQSQNSEEVAPA